MKAPSIESMDLQLGDSRLMVYGLRSYIELLEEGDYTNYGFLDVVKGAMSNDNKNYGTYDNSELYTNPAYLRGMLDVYEKQVEHLSELFGVTNG